MYDLDFLYDYELIQKNSKQFYFAMPFTADTETSSHTERKRNAKAHPATVFLEGKTIRFKMTTKVNVERFNEVIYMLNKFQIFAGRTGTPFSIIYKTLVKDYGFEDFKDEETQLKALYTFLCKEFSRKRQYIESIHGWIYQWAFCFDAEKEVAYSGRTARQLVTLIKDLSDFCSAYGEKLTQEKLQKHYKTKQSRYSVANPSKTALELCTTKVNAVLYFHNLGFDATYIYQLLKKTFKSDFKEFYREPRKPLYMRVGCVELRDSAVYFNETLENITNKYHVAHPKAVGLVDYDKLYFPDDVLPDSAWTYQFNDVFGLQESLLADFKAYGYDVTTAPRTNTGRVRKACREAYLADPQNRKVFTYCYTDGFTQSLLTECLAGGYVHGNRHFKGKIVEPAKSEKGLHDDQRSSYPSQERNTNHLYQFGQFEELEKPTIKSFINNRKTIAIGIVNFTNIRLKNPNFPFPYISTSRMLAGVQIKDVEDEKKKLRYLSDNGRLLWTKGGVSFDLVVTNVDLEIILKMYTYDAFKIKLCMVAPAAPLPAWFCDFIDDFFKQKTELKKDLQELKASGADKDTIYDAENDLEKIKNMFNAIAGMTETNPCKAELIRTADGDFKEASFDYDKKINDYYGYFKGFFAKRSKGFLPFSWGVYTVAYGRKKLFDKIFLTCPYDEKSRSKGKALYCDTDSLFYLENAKIRKLLKEDNEKNYKAAIKGGYYIKDKDGNIVNYDAFDHEDQFKRFKFLHSKCYAYEKITPEGVQLVATIAGVANRALEGLDEDGKPIYIYKEDEIGSLENFTDNFTFKKCGIANSLFISEPFQKRTIKGHVVECGDACIIYHQDKVIKQFKDIIIEEEAEALRKKVR